MALDPSPVIQAVMATAAATQEASLDAGVKQQIQQGLLEIYNAATAQDYKLATLEQQLSNTQQNLSTTTQMLQQSLEMTATAQAARAVAMDDAAAARADAEAAHITADMAQQASATLMTMLMSLQGFTTLLLMLTMTLAAAHLGALLPLQLLAALPLAKWMELTQLFSLANHQQRRAIARQLCACSTVHAALEVMRAAAVSLLLQAVPCIAPQLVFDLYSITPGGVYLLLAAQRSVARLPTALQQRLMHAAAHCRTVEDLCRLMGLTGFFSGGAAPLRYSSPLLLLHAPAEASHSSTLTAIASNNQHSTSDSCALYAITSSSTTAQQQATLFAPQSVLLLSCSSQPRRMPCESCPSFGSILATTSPTSCCKHLRITSNTSGSEDWQHSSQSTSVCDSSRGDQQAQPHCTQASAPAPAQGSTNVNARLLASSCGLHSSSSSSSSHSYGHRLMVAATPDASSQPAVWWGVQPEVDAVVTISAVEHSFKGTAKSTSSSQISSSSSSNFNDNNGTIFTSAPACAATGDVIPTLPAAASAVAMPAAHSCQGVSSQAHSQHKRARNLHQLLQAIKNNFGSSSSSSRSQGMWSRHSSRSTSSSTGSSAMSSQGHQPRRHLLSRLHSLGQHPHLADSGTAEHDGTTAAAAAAASRHGAAQVQPKFPQDALPAHSTSSVSVMDSGLPGSSSPCRSNDACSQHSPGLVSRLTGRSSTAVGSSSMCSSCLPLHRVRRAQSHQHPSSEVLLQDAISFNGSNDILTEQGQGQARCCDAKAHTPHTAASSTRNRFSSLLHSVRVTQPAFCDTGSSDAAASSDLSSGMAQYQGAHP